MDNNLADPDLSPGTYASLDPSVKQPPGWLPGLPPVVEAKHDGEGAGGQQLLVVVVKQAMCGC